MAVFDYVIVGGGSAGATLAARLSEDPQRRTCLIEAGGEGRELLIRAPAGAGLLVPNRLKRKSHNFAYQTVPQAGLNGRRGYQPRGKCLGGSSAINAMLYVRGHPGDYDEWARAGCVGWSYRDVLPFFKRSESNQRGESEFHGASGPLQVGEQQSPRPITTAFIDAAMACGITHNPDFNGAEQEGVGLYQVTQFYSGQRQGERCSVAAAYLHPVMQRPNLTVMTHTHACRVILEGNRAVGVEVQQRSGRKIIRAEREVVLCGGAFNSPQLLLLSGIGDPAELRQHGIPVRHVLPGVGKNLQDHLDFIISYKSKQTDLFGIGIGATARLLREIFEWRKTGKGLVATPCAEGGAFLKSRPELDRPDLQLHFCIALIDDHARKLHRGYGFSCHVCVLRPQSRGTVGLTDANPLSSPRIDPNYLAQANDAALLVQGARQMRRILESPALAKYRHKELYGASTQDDETLLRQIRARADTVYHPAGTCKMGTDAMAVVDPQLRIHGIAGLRVVDASIMPTLIGGNTNAPAIMIAERAAAWIGAEAHSDHGKSVARDLI